MSFSGFKTTGPFCATCACPPVFAENWRQCHGTEDEGGTCTEPINGLDESGHWYSDVDNIWTHYALKDGAKIVEGWLEAVVPPGLSDHPRIFATVPLPKTFRLAVLTPPPAVGQRWRLAWEAQDLGALLALEIRGPESESDECSTFQFVDVSCDEAVELLDRPIPFYFLGPHSREMIVSVCVSEALNRLIFNVRTMSEMTIEGEVVRVPWEFSHHVPYATSSAPEVCTRSLRCYPAWLEIDKGADGTYEFNDFGIYKTRGLSNAGTVVGACDCHAVGDTLFSDAFARADENMALPKDSTGHWWEEARDWFVASQALKTTAATASCVIRAVDHYVETSPSSFVLYGWDFPFQVSTRVKLPSGGESQIYVSAAGFRVALKAGATGRIAILEATGFNTAPTVLSAQNIADVPADEWHTLVWCYNGVTLSARVTLSDGREFSLHIEAAVPGTSSLVRLLVPGTALGNAAGDYLFDDFSVSRANDATPSAPGYGYGYGVEDNCPCCGPTGCQTSPPLASDLDSCLWESSGGSSVYRGSWSALGRGCNETDDTTKISLTFQVTDAAGSVTVTLGEHWVQVKFTSLDDPTKSELILSTEETRLVAKLTVDSFGTLNFCLGAGSLVATLNGGPPLTGRIGSPLPTADRPTLDISGATVTFVEISHDIYSTRCPDCFGGQTAPCSDPTQANCAGGIVAQALVANISFAMSLPGIFCCGEYADVLRGSIVLKTSGSTSLASGADCCDIEASSITQCIYTWSGGALIPCEASNPDEVVASVSVHKYSDGYRLCGSLRFSGTGPGSAPIGTFSGISDVISPPDEPVDCLSVGGQIPLTCWVGAGPGFDTPPCGLNQMILNVGPA